MWVKYKDVTLIRYGLPASVPKIIGLVGAFLRQLLVRLYTERRMNIFQQ